MKRGVNEKTKATSRSARRLGFTFMQRELMRYSACAISLFALFFVGCNSVAKGGAERFRDLRHHSLVWRNLQEPVTVEFDTDHLAAAYHRLFDDCKAQLRVRYTIHMVPPFPPYRVQSPMPFRRAYVKVPAYEVLMDIARHWNLDVALSAVPENEADWNGGEIWMIASDLCESRTK